jgi:signal transduction histidine kinase
MKTSKDMTRMYGGLGLATVKLLLELHHSEVKVNSKKGEGTKFLFHLSFNYTMGNDGSSNKAKLQKS